MEHFAWFSIRAICITVLLVFIFLDIFGCFAFLFSLCVHQYMCSRDVCLKQTLVILYQHFIDILEFLLYCACSHGIHVQYWTKTIFAVLLVTCLSVASRAHVTLVQKLQNKST